MSNGVGKGGSGVTVIGAKCVNCGGVTVVGAKGVNCCVSANCELVDSIACEIADILSRNVCNL